jgi:hypothetical protein
MTDIMANPIAIVLYFFVFGLIGVAIGQRKGRGFAGFIFGILLGPIGWVVVLLGPDLKSEQESTRLRKCPYCAELVQPDAKLCKHCGKNIEEVVVSEEEKFERWKKNRDSGIQTPASRSPAPEKAFEDLSIPCPQCGHSLKVSTLKQGENYCPHCSQKFIAE